MSFTPLLLHHFTPLGRPKKSKSGGLICLLPPYSYTILPPWKPNAAQKDVRVLSCIFLKNPPIAAPLLHHFTPPPPTWQPNSYIILPLLDNLPPHSYTILPPWRPNSYIIFSPLNNLPPHSYTILPPLAAELLHHFTPSGQFTPSLLHHFTPLRSPTLTSFYPPWINYPLTLTPVSPIGSPSHTSCSPLQPTLTSQFQSVGVIPEKSSHCSPLFHGIFSQRGNS